MYFYSIFEGSILEAETNIKVDIYICIILVEASLSS